MSMYSILQSTNGRMYHLECFLVGGGSGEGSVGKSNTRPGNVVNAVEALQKSEPVDEIQARSRERSHIGGDQVDLAVVSSEHGVQGPGPNLGVGGQLELSSTDLEEQAFKTLVLGFSDGEKAGGLVHDGASCGLVGLEGISGNHE